MLERLQRKTNELARNPRPASVKKLAGDEQSGYRIRVGDVRVLYTIDDKERIVRIFDIEPRDKAYRKR
ncbi:type II toxin-antitoxin system RelE/ParE family toxin [bacterium]|nr:type II toxin-antitoxin system RelE/ParE family toxin [bacterium]